jgi:hypothetical protein
MGMRTRSWEPRERSLSGVALAAVAVTGSAAATETPGATVDAATVTPGLVLRFGASGLALVGPQPGFTRKVRWSAVSGLRFGASGVLPGGVGAVSLSAVVNGWAVRCWVPWSEIRPDEVRALDRMLATLAPCSARTRVRVPRAGRRVGQGAGQPIVGVAQPPVIGMAQSSAVEVAQSQPVQPPRRPGRIRFALMRRSWTAKA